MYGLPKSMCVVFVIPVGVYSRCVPSMSDLYVCMRDMISPVSIEFNSEIEGSLEFRALMLFLCSILCYVLEVVCMWSLSFLLGCCVCLR